MFIRQLKDMMVEIVVVEELVVLEILHQLQLEQHFLLLVVALILFQVSLEHLLGMEQVGEILQVVVHLDILVATPMQEMDHLAVVETEQAQLPILVAVEAQGLVEHQEVVDLVDLVV
jgi:hypothetical protein